MKAYADTTAVAHRYSCQRWDLPDGQGTALACCSRKGAMTSSNFSSTCSQQQLHLEQAAAGLLACELPTVDVLLPAVLHCQAGWCSLPASCMQRELFGMLKCRPAKGQGCKGVDVLGPGLKARRCTQAMPAVIEASTQGKAPVNLVVTHLITSRAWP